SLYLMLFCCNFPKRNSPYQPHPNTPAVFPFQSSLHKIRNFSHHLSYLILLQVHLLGPNHHSVLTAPSACIYPMVPQDFYHLLPHVILQDYLQFRKENLFPIEPKTQVLLVSLLLIILEFVTSKCTFQFYIYLAKMAYVSFYPSIYTTTM